MNLNNFSKKTTMITGWLKGQNNFKISMARQKLYRHRSYMVWTPKTNIEKLLSIFTAYKKFKQYELDAKVLSNLLDDKERRLAGYDERIVDLANANAYLKKRIKQLTRQLNS